MRFLEEQTHRYAEEIASLYELERAACAQAEDAARALEASYDGPVRALAAALELRDDLSGRHAERVTAVVTGVSFLAGIARDVVTFHHKHWEGGR